MFSYFSIPLVICLSDDDDNNDISKPNTTNRTPIKNQELSTIGNNAIYDPSAWIIDEKDIIHVSALPSKYSDIFKKAFEIRCSAIHFGITEFGVDSEVVIMHATEFELKLIGNKDIV